MLKIVTMVALAVLQFLNNRNTTLIFSMLPTATIHSTLIRKAHFRLLKPNNLKKRKRCQMTQQVPLPMKMC